VFIATDAVLVLPGARTIVKRCVEVVGDERGVRLDDRAVGRGHALQVPYVLGADLVADSDRPGCEDLRGRRRLAG
jgi:hypothetical protein